MLAHQNPTAIPRLRFIEDIFLTAAEMSANHRPRNRHGDKTGLTQIQSCTPTSHFGIWWMIDVRNPMYRSD
jgi:hypothetical protein